MIFEFGTEIYSLIAAAVFCAATVAACAG